METLKHCRVRCLGWMLGAAVGISAGQAQFLPEDNRAEEDQERVWAEHERERQLELAYEARRARAHARLGSAASSVEPQAICPALVSPADVIRPFGKRISRPFVARNTPRPARPRWRGVAPPGESPGGLFGEYISEQVVQARCVNCHVAGGVSGHTRLVLSRLTVEGHEALNLAVFEDFLATVEDAADLILHKIQGVGHGGGIQVPAGSADFANMERFLRLLGGGSSSGSLSPETLFDGVTMASPAKTLRRAALIFAGRLPTRAELHAVNDGRDSSLRRAIRNLMTGPGFHEFLIRASNDRLLTDKFLTHVNSLTAESFFVDLNNMIWEARKAALDRGYENYRHDPAYRKVEPPMHFGFARAPLELVAHVVENDLPYTEILTADYVMANAVAAQAYGAGTRFDDPEDPGEFKPSEIVSYYRDDDSKVVEVQRPFGRRVINPGNLLTDYPHAGILSTTVFLQRYPTTATNRNRARARWTYSHFLGLDVEKSAARTTDPDALADTDNPTMKNPACTVCHSVLDPVAGAFQNYGDEGFYRDNYRGLDSLAGIYKHPDDGSVSLYQHGDTWYRDMREPGFRGESAPRADNSLQWLAHRIAADERFAEATVKFWWPAVMGAEVLDPPEDGGDRHFEAQLLASTAQSAQVSRLADEFRRGIAGGHPYNAKDLLAEITLSPWFQAESVAGEDPIRDEALRHAGVERLLTPEELDRKTEAVSGFVWGRSFIGYFLGAGQAKTALNDWRGRSGYGLLYGGIDSNGITKRAGDLTALMAAVALSHAAEVSCPIVSREFFFWPEDQRLLFGGFDAGVALNSVAQGSYSITSENDESLQTELLSTFLKAGEKTVRLGFTNPYHDGPGPGHHRVLHLDRLVVRDDSGGFEQSVELESLGLQECGEGAGDYYQMHKACSVNIPIHFPADDQYHIEVEAFAWSAGDEAAQLEISVELDGPTSDNEMAIRRKLVELHEKLLGITVGPDSPDVEAAYGLFVATWRNGSTSDSRFECSDHRDHLYFDGIAEDPGIVEIDENGDSSINWDRRRDFFNSIDTSDPENTVRAWVVTLAYLLSDYRYLYF